MSSDKYYTAVYLRVLYEGPDGLTKKHFHRIEATKLTHFFVSHAPSTYQDPVWRKIRNACKERCNKVIVRNNAFVGHPSIKPFYMRHIEEVLQAISTDDEDVQVYEIKAKMYPWSDKCDEDMIQKDLDSANQVLEIHIEDIPVC
jgi:hypothetical protein